MTLSYPSTDPNSITLSEWGHYWLETYVKPVAKPGAYEHYHDNFCKHILPFLGDIKLRELNSSTIQRFLNQQACSGNLKTGGGLSAKSIKNMRVTLECCCKWAVAENIIPSNPVAATVIRRNSGKRVAVMSNNDQKVLEEWLFATPCPRNAAIQISLFSGTRLGEVCALRWKDADRAAGTLHIHETARRVSNYDSDGVKTRIIITSAKTDASDRILYLPKVLLDCLDWLHGSYVEKHGHEPSPDDFIITNSNGGLMDPDNLSSYFSRVLRNLGLPHIKYHALRHTFATRAVENGVDIATVSGILGHADVTTTTHYYVCPREEAMRRTMVALRPISHN